MPPFKSKKPKDQMAALPMPGAPGARLKTEAARTKTKANAKAPAFRQKAADAEGAKGGRYKGRPGETAGWKPALRGQMLPA